MVETCGHRAHRPLNPAAIGQEPKYRLLKWLPVSSHSRYAASAKQRRVAKKTAQMAASCEPDTPRRILSARNKI
jgi:hypothetical protein